MADAPALAVTNIEQEKTMNTEGRHTWRVHFTTPSGTRTHVEVPATADEYTPQKVAQHIADETARVEGVHALEGVPLPPPGVRA